MNKDKNRVPQFYTKIDLSKLKSNFFGSVFDFGRPTGSFFTLYKYLWIVKEYELIFLIFLSLSFWNITIMGCAHPQFGAFAQKIFRFYHCTGYWTRSQNKWYCTIRKRSANKYKGLNIVFIIILPLNIPSKLTKTI